MTYRGPDAWLRSAHVANLGARLCPPYLFTAPADDGRQGGEDALVSAKTVPLVAPNPQDASGTAPLISFNIALGEHGTALLLLLAAHFNTTQADVVSRALSALAEQVGIPALARPLDGLGDYFREGERRRGT